MQVFVSAKVKKAKFTGIKEALPTYKQKFKQPLYIKDFNAEPDKQTCICDYAYV